MFDEPAAERRGIEDPQTPLTFQNILAWVKGYVTPAGEGVTLDAARRFPAYAAAESFLTKTIAGLPLHVYRVTRKDGREAVVKDTGRLQSLLRDQVNDELSSYAWREHGMGCMLGSWRWLSYIERGDGGAPVNIFPIDPLSCEIAIVNRKKRYRVAAGGRTAEYAASDIIDIAWNVANDGVATTTPFDAARGAIGLGLALQNYAAGFFRNGGMPPLALIGNFQSGDGIARAAKDMSDQVRRSAEMGSQVLPIPLNHELKPLGFDPQKGQMVEAETFQVVQVARAFNLPPVFLQDLTHGTFTNSEQQDLHLVKHTLTGLCAKIEAELNLKLFPRYSRTRWVAFNLDGLLRGDYRTRMEGHAKAITAGVRTPNDARELENLPPIEGGDQAFIQGAMRPLTEPYVAGAPAPPEDKDNADANRTARRR